MEKKTLVIGTDNEKYADFSADTWQKQADGGYVQARGKDNQVTISFITAGSVTDPTSFSNETVLSTQHTNIPEADLRAAIAANLTHNGDPVIAIKAVVADVNQSFQIEAKIGNLNENNVTEI